MYRLQSSGQCFIAVVTLDFKTTVFIMTTNFEEKIKGVLDRPGRIDYHMKFKKMGLTEIENMVKNFFQLLETHQWAMLCLQA